MPDPKIATANMPEPLPPAEHEKALEALERRSQRLKLAADRPSDAATAEMLPEVHSAFND